VFRADIGQRRADALVAICAAALTDDTVGRLPAWQGRRPQVIATVALSTLVGLDNQPGELDGYGPVTAAAVRELLADASCVLRSAVTDDTGRLLHLGRTTYRPSQALRELVITRDGSCRFPGCERPARRAELDHVTAWAAGGGTDAETMLPECRRHHHAKHDAGWHVERLADGTARWTSPTRQVTDVVPHRLPIGTLRFKTARHAVVHDVGPPPVEPGPPPF
jgi:hypothetical protein